MSQLSTYTQEFADKFCDEIATTNKGIHRLCYEHRGEPGWVSSRTIFNWLNNNEAFAHQYARAKEEQIHRLGEEILAIVDETENDVLAEVELKTTSGFIVVEKENKEFVNSKRLRMDARKWLMSKLLPKVYGDKLEENDDKKFTIIVTEE